MKKAGMATAAIAVMAVAGYVQAAVLTTSYSDSFTGAAYDFSDTMSLSQFDGSMGTLLSAELSWVFDIDSTAGVENLSANAGSIDLEQEFTIVLDNGTLGTLATEGSSFTASEAVTGYDGNLDYAGTSGFDASEAPQYTNGVTYTDAPTLAYFTGLGDVLFDVEGDVTISSEFIGSGSGTLVQNWTTLGDGTLTIEYTYETAGPTPVPSPAAIWAGVILAGSSLMSRRRKA